MRKESKEIEPYFSVWALLMWTESVRGAKGLREKSETGKVKSQNHFSHKVKLPPFTISKHILTWGFVIVFSQARKWSLWTVINWGQYYTQWNLPLSTRATLSQHTKLFPICNHPSKKNWYVYVFAQSFDISSILQKDFGDFFFTVLTGNV